MGDGAGLSVNKGLRMLVRVSGRAVRLRQAGWHRRSGYFLSQQNNSEGTGFFMFLRKTILQEEMNHDERPDYSLQNLSE